MIYLVSSDQRLFKSEAYQVVSIDIALKALEPLKEVECDTETKGLDPYTKPLLTIQLGNKDIQVVFDVTTGIHPKLKEYLESDRLFLFWNAQFDLMFLYHHNVWVNHVYDGMLAEQLLYLGYDNGIIGYSLKDSAYRYGIADIDKSVRGAIINEGLTERVVIYAAGDVMYLSAIRDKQMVKIKEEHLEKALEIENEFVKCLAYIKYCGVHLDVDKWKAKMAKDRAKLDEAIKELNDWVIQYFYKCNGDTKTMTIETEEIVDSQYLHDAEKLHKQGFDIVPLDNNAISYYKKESNNPKVGLLYCQKVRRKFPYLKMDYQGDLFSGFNTDPICILNWSSQKQIIPLFEHLGFKLDTFDKKTKEKKKSVGKDIIKAQKHICTIAPIYLKYKEADKVCSAFGQNWLNAINPESHRIHVDFHQLGTATARLSSGGGPYKLNLQQLPHDAVTRACFTAMKGNKWISCDYDSQESQLLASVANDPAMLELYRTGCGDMHALVAKMSYSNIIPEDVRVEDIKKLYPEQRQDSKGIEFAINPILF